LGSPWQTIQKAANSIAIDDTVNVRAGDYRPQGLINISSTGVIFQNYNDEVPIIDKLIIDNSQGLTVKGFRITGSQTYSSNWQDMPSVVVDNPSISIDPHQIWFFRKNAVYQKYATYTNMLDDWTNNWTSGIEVRNSVDLTIEDNELSYHSAGINLTDESINISVVNNIFHHNMIAVHTWYTSGYAFSLRDSTIVNNHVTQSFRDGIRLRKNADNNAVTDNIITYSGAGHIDTHEGSTNNIIKHNLLSYGGYYAETLQNPGPSAISIHSSGQGNQVLGNVISYQQDITLFDGNGIIVDLTPDGALVANNISVRNMGSGITSTGSGPSVIIHNTLVENGYQTASEVNGVGVRIGPEDNISNVIANNILDNNYIGGLFFQNNLTEQQFVNYNLYSLSNDTWLAANGLQLYDDLSAFQGSGFGTDSQQVNPGFADGQKCDFTLLNGSAAINQGTSVHMYADDIIGTARPQGSAPDVGGVEYIDDTLIWDKQAYLSEICVGDEDDNNQVNSLDFVSLIRPSLDVFSLQRFKLVLSNLTVLLF
jgi:parallel beta-helix repeat protein